MPLGFRLGDRSDSRMCGVETEFFRGMPQLIRLGLAAGKFDFLVSPLVDPAYRPSLSEKDNAETYANFLPVSGSDLIVPAAEWNESIFGKISSWIDLDSEDETLRTDSEIVLKQEITWASYLSLQACLLPAPKGTSCVNYARCVNQHLQDLKNMKLWLRIPVGKSEFEPSITLADPWRTWDSFRQLCEHHSKLCIALEPLNLLPNDKALERWFGEPVSAAILRTDVFKTKVDGDYIGKYIPERHQTLITRFLDHSVQIIISGDQGKPQAVEDLKLVPVSAKESERHPLRYYREHAVYLYDQMGSLPEQERLEFGLRDVLQSPLQPLKNNLDSLKYENLEKNSEKYVQYQRAICQALLDRVPDENASETTTVLMVVGAGRGPLVRVSLQVAKETRRKLKVYAVEKNPNAVAALKDFVESENYADLVTVVSSDMRYWNAPETADILVSEMLGSFGDNELSPECLDGAQRFLKEDGISIPSSYTSFLQPVTASKIHTNMKKHKDISHFEAAYLAKIHDVDRLAPSQPVFTFSHPKNLDTESNERYKKLHFVITGPVMVHGFAGYFDAILYKDVHIGTEPSTATPNLLHRLSMFFPLKIPIVLDRGSNTLEVHFWRFCDSAKVWYEWCVASPSLSPVHNSNGRSYSVEL